MIEKMKYLSRYLAVVIFFVPLITFGSGSVIGNGGDPLFYFLEATRYSLNETIKTVLNDASEQKKFCQRSTLSPEQIQVCRDFFFAVADQVLKLNQGTAKTLFVLKEETLLVIGPDGKPMPVAARTQLGPSGEVEFNRDAIKLMAPTQILFLMAHEFNHKSSYQGRYLTDNEPFGPFATGRELIDSVAASVVDAAKRKGKVGSQYGLRDSFECLVRVDGSRFGVRVSSPRGFLTEDLMSYETSLSRNPTDPILFVPESNDTNLVFKVVTSEPANCSDDAKFTALRHTDLFIIRQFQNLKSGSAQKDVEVARATLAGYNPMCEKVPTEFNLSFDKTRFNCRFFGTEGTTSSLKLKVKSP